MGMNVKVIGSTYLPSLMVSKWRWHPTADPVSPMSPITWPTSTDSPVFTAAPSMWLYVVTSPSPWSISTRFPPPHGCQPAARTTPESAA
jgi:hypothetical protein